MRFNWFNNLLLKGVCKVYGWGVGLNKEQVRLMVESLAMSKVLKRKEDKDDGKN